MDSSIIHISSEDLELIIRKTMNFCRSVNQIRSIGRQSMDAFFLDYCINGNMITQLNEIVTVCLKYLPDSKYDLIVSQARKLEILSLQGESWVNKTASATCRRLGCNVNKLPSFLRALVNDHSSPPPWFPAQRVKLEKKVAFIDMNMQGNPFYIYRSLLEELSILLVSVIESVRVIADTPDIDKGRWLSYFFDSKEWDIQARESQFSHDIYRACHYPSEWSDPGDYFKITREMLEAKGVVVPSYEQNMEI